MRKSTALGTLTIVFALGMWQGLPTADQQAQKPIEASEIHSEFTAPMGSLHEAIQDVDVVVHGRVIGARPSDAPIEGGGSWVRTGHRVRVLESFPSAQGVDLTDQEIIVIQKGGDRDRGSYIQRVVNEGFPLLRVGKEYILFLVRFENDWAIAHGPNGVLEKAAPDVVIPWAKFGALTQLKGRRWSDIVSLFRAQGIKREM